MPGGFATASSRTRPPPATAREGSERSGLLLALRYPTPVPVRCIVSQLRSLLAERGATDVRILDRGNAPAGIQFSVPGRGRVMHFAMLADVDRAYRALARRGVLTGDARHRRRQAERAAWRSILCWVRAAGDFGARDGAG